MNNVDSKVRNEDSDRGVENTEGIRMSVVSVFILYLESWVVVTVVNLTLYDKSGCIIDGSPAVRG